MDRRRFERFEIELPARMEIIASNKKRVFDLVTRNISASGAFVNTTNAFSDGAPIKMSLTTQSKRLNELTGAQILIECEGSIVRNTPTGVAICFCKECQLLSLNGLAYGN